MNKYEFYSEQSKNFHEKAGQLTHESDKELLTISIGIISALFVFVSSRELSSVFKIIFIITVIFFSFTIIGIILAMYINASRYYFYGIKNGNYNASRKRTACEKIEVLNKRSFLIKQIYICMFLAGFLSAFALLMGVFHP